jgi:hypothetical protein
LIVQSFAPLAIEERYREDFDNLIRVIGATPTLDGVQVRLSWADEVHQPED